MSYTDYDGAEDSVYDSFHTFEDDENELEFERPDYSGFLLKGEASMATRTKLTQRARQYGIELDNLPEPFINDLCKLFEDETLRLDAATADRAALAKSLLRANAFVLRNLTSGDSTFTAEAVLQFVQSLMQNLSDEDKQTLSKQMQGEKGDEQGEGDGEGENENGSNKRDKGKRDGTSGDGDSEQNNDSSDGGDRDGDGEGDDGDNSTDSASEEGADSESSDGGSSDQQHGQSDSGDSSGQNEPQESGDSQTGTSDGCGKGEKEESDKPLSDDQKKNFDRRMKSAMQKAWNSTEKRINRLNNFKEFGMTSDEAVELSRASDLSDNVTINNEMLTNFVNRLLQKIKTGLHGKLKAETRGFTDADPEIVDFMNPETLLHPCMLPDACVVNEFPRLSIDIYIDHSGSMNTQMIAANEHDKKFVELKRFEMAKLVASKLIDMGVVNDIYFFDTWVNDRFTIKAATKFKLYTNKAKPDGYTAIDRALTHHIEKRNISLIITDGDDHIREWSDNCFFFFIDSQSVDDYFRHEFNSSEKEGAERPITANRYVRSNMAAAYVSGKIVFSKDDFMALDTRTPAEKKAYANAAWNMTKDEGFQRPTMRPIQLEAEGWENATKRAPSSDIDIARFRRSRRRRRYY